MRGSLLSGNIPITPVPAIQLWCWYTFIMWIDQALLIMPAQTHCNKSMCTVHEMVWFMSWNIKPKCCSLCKFCFIMLRTTLPDGYCKSLLWVFGRHHWKQYDTTCYWLFTCETVIVVICTCFYITSAGIGVMHVRYGSFARYVKFRVAHAPGTFSPPPTSKETAS